MGLECYACDVEFDEPADVIVDFGADIGDFCPECSAMIEAVVEARRSRDVIAIGAEQFGGGRE